MGWVTIDLTKWERVVSPCTGGTSMVSLTLVLVGNMSAPISTRIYPMPWVLIVGISLVTPCEWWMTNITWRGCPHFS
jgi:hypothetical protein